jgi:LemA protein
MVTLIVILALVVLLVIVFVAIYNNLVTLRNTYKNAYAQIDVQLKRRYDLIPNLVETAKGYLQHERQTLEAVIAARNQAFTAAKAAAENPGDPKTMASLAQAEGVLGGALGRLLAVVEQYPNLKANETMSQLMEELTATENKIAFARQFFNDAVLNYKNARERFPNNLIANMFGFQDAAFLEATESEEERKAPKVKF